MALTKEEHRAIIEHDYHQIGFSQEKYLDELVKNQEDAEKWNKLNSAFPDKIDWEKIEYFAVKDSNGKPHIAQLFSERMDYDYEVILKDREIVERLKKEYKNQLEISKVEPNDVYYVLEEILGEENIGK